MMHWLGFLFLLVVFAASRMAGRNCPVTKIASRIAEGRAAEAVIWV